MICSPFVHFNQGSIVNRPAATKILFLAMGEKVHAPEVPGIINAKDSRQVDLRSLSPSPLFYLIRI